MVYGSSFFYNFFFFIIIILELLMSWLVVTLCNPRVLGLVWLGCLNNSFKCLCIELKTVGLKKTCLVMVFFIGVFELRYSF